MKKNRSIKCLLFGHKSNTLNDSGYPVCERCGSHSYYDNWNDSGYLLKPFMYASRKWRHVKSNVKYWFSRVFLGDQLPF